MLMNLRAALAARRLRQVDLALSLKIPPSTLSEIICGRRPADPSQRARIAVALCADEARIPAVNTNALSPGACT